MAQVVFLPQGPLSAAHSSSPPPPTHPHSRECPPSPGPSPGPSSHTDRSHHNSSSGRTGRDFPWSPQFYLQSLKPSLCAVHTRLTHARSGCAFLRAHLSLPTALSLTGATASLAWRTACPGSHPGPRPSLPPLQSSTFPLSAPQPPSSFLHPSPWLPRSRPEPLHSNAPSSELCPHTQAPPARPRLLLPHFSASPISEHSSSLQSVST